ncbi:MAG: signal peptidase I, partial [Isosphaeraceae bacterium]
MSRDSATSGTKKGAKEKRSSPQRTLLEYLALAVVAVAVALLIQAFLVKPYRIPSASMKDTLLIGDRVLVDRISWRFSDPMRGDIVVFHSPVPGPVLIKRIVGMPGDTVSLKDGAVYINGQKLNEPYVRRVDGQPEPTDPFQTGLPWSLQQSYQVPAGSYFLMGDNRGDSGDSRYFGPVARGQLVGRSFGRYWPPGRMSGLK